MAACARLRGVLKHPELVVCTLFDNLNYSSQKIKELSRIIRQKLESHDRVCNCTCGTRCLFESEIDQIWL